MARLRKRTTAVERQRLYRARLAERGAATSPDEQSKRGAPETRLVVQSLAAAVRTLAAAISTDPATKAKHGESFQEIMRLARLDLIAKGFDPAESTSRMVLYVLPEKRRKRRLKRDTEARYWSSPPVPVRMLPTTATD